MADYYTQGVVHPFLPLDDDTVAALSLVLEDIDYDEEADRYTAANPVEEIFLKWIDSYGGEVDEFTSVAFDVEGDGEGKTYLYFQESFGDFEVHVLQQILRNLPEADVPLITVEYANTCSRHRPDGFGGGAHIITRDDVHSMHTWGWLEENVLKLTGWRKSTEGGEACQ